MQRESSRGRVYPSAKATIDEILASQARLNQSAAEFLEIDVETALEFCKIARQTRDPRRKIRNRHHARHGYDTIVHLLDRVRLTNEQAHNLDEKLKILRTELVYLGEPF
jgi:hypothetical protein